MTWEATDQFGNLFVATTDAQSPDGLAPDLDSLIDELTRRTPGPITLTINPAYQEITGPDPEAVSHILQIPWLDPTNCDACAQAVQTYLQTNQHANIAVVTEP